jgi:arylsulfatase
LHAPKEYIEKYRGKFDKGWDAVRTETFERQKQMGIIAADAVLPPPNPGIQAWADLNETQRTVYCRLQEVFAGFLDHTDHHLGRLVNAIDAMGLRDDTLILLVSDNGASQEGLRDGTANTDRFRNYSPDTVEEIIGKLDELGSPSTDPHYPMGWAMAGNSPLKRWKQDTHSGGNTDPLIVSWPSKIKDGGGFRRQYHHVVDVVPTLLELTDLPAPTSVNGVSQMELPGVSMAYTFDDADAPTRKKVQYYEMLGSRAIWADGWTAVTWHKKGADWADDKWELYHTAVDFTQANDLAAEMPEKLKELQELWRSEAEKYGVLPLDDRRYERVADPTRPVAAVEKPVYTYYPETSIVHPLAAPQLLGKPHTVTAHVTIPADGAEGVLACFGGEFGGWSFFVQGGKLKYVHNYLKMDEFTVESNVSVPAGKHELAFRFAPTETSLKPDYFIGVVTLMVDGKEVGSLQGMKSAGQYSAVTGYGLVTGRNPNTSVTHQYETPFRFTGQFEKVAIVLEQQSTQTPKR